MNFLFRLLLLFGCVLVLSSCAAEYHTEGECNPNLYHPDFNFAKEHNDLYQEWLIQSPLGVHKEILIDAKKDSIPVLFSGGKGGGFTSNYRLIRNILLPEKSSEINIELEGAFTSISSLHKTIVSISYFAETHILKTDTLIIEDTQNIIKTTYRTTIPTHVNQIYICLENNGLGLFALKKCIILVDHKPIESLSFNRKIALPITLKNQLNESASLKDSLPDSRILALGESLHGTSEFQENRNDLIRKQVLSGKCKLIIDEMSPSMGYLVNEYIQGRRDIISDIFNESDYSSSKPFQNLLFFLRKYNRDNLKKVTFAGFDISFNKPEINDSQLLELLLRKNSDLAPNICDTIKALLNVKTITLGKFNKLKEEVKAYLTSIPKKNKEQDFLLYYVNNILHNNSSNRDSIMFENISFLVDKFGQNSQSIITAHLAHLIKSQNCFILFNKPSAGYYLSKKFGDQYYVLAQIAAQGSVLINKPYGYTLSWENAALAFPINNSIEQLCMELDFPQFYINDTQKEWIKEAKFIRLMGRQWMAMQFFCINMHDEIDALVFYKRVSSFQQ